MKHKKNEKQSEAGPSNMGTGSVVNAPTRAGYKDSVAGLPLKWGNDSGYNSAIKPLLGLGK